MIDIPRDPSRRDLTIFGILLGPFAAFVGWLLWRSSLGPAAGWIVWGAGGALWLLYLVWPAARRRIYVGWILAVYPVGWIVSHTIVVVVYYLVITPVGLLLRLTGRDPMQRRGNARAESYWTKREPAKDSGRYFRQF